MCMFVACNVEQDGMEGERLFPAAPHNSTKCTGGSSASDGPKGSQEGTRGEVSHKGETLTTKNIGRKDLPSALDGEVGADLGEGIGLPYIG